jgi:beta-1,4-mannosyl-glycoprotein beta-1,4-N-acetylglucosaminyltransferase
MLIDCFTFYNELDLLSLRLHELYNVVDYFVIVEGVNTFTGREKPLYFSQNKHLYEQYLNKIVHVIAEGMNSSDPWVNERAQRDEIGHGLVQLNASDTDLIIVSDADEIPDKNTLQRITEMGITDTVILEQDLYYYNLCCKYDGVWARAAVTPYLQYKKVGGASGIRAGGASRISRGGWHFSYFGDVEFIKNKIKSFSHYEYNNEYYLNTERITASIKNNTDLYNRNEIRYLHIPIQSNTYLPENIHLIQSKYE